jgi:septum site-determining protein MinD
MRFADAAVIVANSEVSSVRDSDRIIGLPDSKTVKAEKGEPMEKHLLITRFDSARAARGEMLAIEDVLEILSVPLLGIIPENEAVLRAPARGDRYVGGRYGRCSVGRARPGRAGYDSAASRW